MKKNIGQSYKKWSIETANKLLKMAIKICKNEKNDNYLFIIFKKRSVVDIYTLNCLKKREKC